MKEIAECPFCANEDVKLAMQDIVMFTCDDCGAVVTFQNISDDVEKSIKRYNYRPLCLMIMKEFFKDRYKKMYDLVTGIRKQKNPDK